MSMDMDYPVDLVEVKDIVSTSEVVLVRMATVRKRLLLDFRSNAYTKPLVRLVQRSRSPEDRFRELRRLRPGLEVPDQIMTFFWPKSIVALKETGVLAHIIDKVNSSGYPEMEEECRQMFQELLDLEQSELIAAVEGDGYQSLWERKAPA